MNTDYPPFWDQLYNNASYVFGEEPNDYLAQQLATFPKGKILLPGDGEGRNAVYCAKQGWDVFAFDLSEIGKQKALSLARRNKVTIHVEVVDVCEIHFPNAYFDVIGLIFAHFTPEKRRNHHRQLLHYLKPNGYIVLEGFARNDNEQEDIRFNLNEIKEDFPDVEWIECKTETVVLHEGQMIQGENKVVRALGKKTK